jgi:hypothetical protein
VLKDQATPNEKATNARSPSGHNHPDRNGDQEQKPDPATPAPSQTPPGTYPPDSIPNPMPGVDPQQTPGIDGVPAEENLGDCRLAP